MAESNHQNYVRTEWLKSAMCPKCGEQNGPIRSMLVQLEDDGTAECKICNHTWRPNL